MRDIDNLGAGNAYGQDVKEIFTDQGFLQLCVQAVEGFLLEPELSPAQLVCPDPGLFVDGLILDDRPRIGKVVLVVVVGVLATGETPGRPPSRGGSASGSVAGPRLSFPLASETVRRDGRYSRVERGASKGTVGDEAVLRSCCGKFCASADRTEMKFDLQERERESGRAGEARFTGGLIVPLVGFPHQGRPVLLLQPCIEPSARLGCSSNTALEL